ncbi:NADP-dependent oxidoreductase [Arcticibacter eurypsychrophilus]|uniref:NADP-dependent oxidoreductase n=1 Tax=Arcticibacter eurypsychrophilus TaxID=1434752 RepID=UPI00084D7A77|nr:NADP-dependent oxidoreductase [Arcticibacter eurypsychrophilus]
MNKIILLDKRPVGKVSLNDFKFVQEEIPQPMEGEILLKTLYVSVDPYLRGRMNDSKSYVPPFQLHEPIESGIVAKVVQTNNAAFKEGDIVSGSLKWQQYQVSKGVGLNKIEDDGTSLTAYLGILGMTGLTAYCGLLEIGKPKAGETLVVSGAAGAVGSVVGQIGKLLGCKVVGIAGTDEKVEMLKSEFHFDGAINYKTTPDLKKAIQDACPDGVDIYFDNVGAEISDAVLVNINKFARIPVCGAISLYNGDNSSNGLRVSSVLLSKSALMQGFIVSNYADKFPAAIKQLTAWVKEGKLISSETIEQGFDHIPQAFLDLFDGKNKGKMIVDCTN